MALLLMNLSRGSSPRRYLLQKIYSPHFLALQYQTQFYGIQLDDLSIQFSVLSCFKLFLLSFWFNFINYRSCLQFIAEGMFTAIVPNGTLVYLYPTLKI